MRLSTAAPTFDPSVCSGKKFGGAPADDLRMRGTRADGGQEDYTLGVYQADIIASMGRKPSARRVGARCLPDQADTSPPR